MTATCRGYTRTPSSREELERCYSEQREHADALAASPGHVGLKLAVADWAVEEVLIRAEGEA